MTKIVFIDGLDRTGKSTIIRLISGAYTLRTGGGVAIVKLPSDEFRKGELWNSMITDNKSNWNLPFIMRWAEAVIADMVNQISMARESLVKGTDNLVLVDRSFISTFIYQAAVYLHNKHIDSDQTRVFLREWFSNVFSNAKTGMCKLRRQGTYDDKYYYYIMTDRLLKAKDDNDPSRNSTPGDDVFEELLQDSVAGILKSYQDLIVYDIAAFESTSISVLGNYNHMSSLSDFDLEFLKNYNLILGAIL